MGFGTTLPEPLHNSVCHLDKDLVQAAQASGHVEVSALAVSQYQASTDADEVDLALIEALLMYICGEGPYRRAEEQDAALGAVLIFLPGAPYLLVSPHPNWFTSCTLRPVTVFESSIHHASWSWAYFILWRPSSPSVSCLDTRRPQECNLLEMVKAHIPLNRVG